MIVYDVPFLNDQGVYYRGQPTIVYPNDIARERKGFTLRETKTLSDENLLSLGTETGESLSESTSIFGSAREFYQVVFEKNSA